MAYDLVPRVFHLPTRESGRNMPPKKWGVTKKTMRGRYNQVTILSFLNPLWRGKIYVKYNTSYMCHSMGCEILCEVKCYRLRKRFIQRLVTQEMHGGVTLCTSISEDFKSDRSLSRFARYTARTSFPRTKST